MVNCWLKPHYQEYVFMGIKTSIYSWVSGGFVRLAPNIVAPPIHFSGHAPELHCHLGAVLFFFVWFTNLKSLYLLHFIVKWRSGTTLHHYTASQLWYIMGWQRLLPEKHQNYSYKFVGFYFYMYQISHWNLFTKHYNHISFFVKQQ